MFEGQLPSQSFPDLLCFVIFGGGRLSLGFELINFLSSSQLHGPAKERFCLIFCCLSFRGGPLRIQHELLHKSLNKLFVARSIHSLIDVKNIAWSVPCDSGRCSTQKVSFSAVCLQSVFRRNVVLEELFCDLKLGLDARI